MCHGETMDEAVKCVQKWAWAYDVEEALTHFVFHWSFLHTGLYPPQHEMSKEQMYIGPAEELANLLSFAMLNGYANPIGDLITRMQLAGLIKSHDQQNSATHKELGITKLKESSCEAHFLETSGDFASLTMQKMTEMVEYNQWAINPLEGTKFTIEDTDSLRCAASLIQIFHRLEYLSKKIERYAYPEEVYINNSGAAGGADAEKSFYLKDFNPIGQP